MDYLACRTRVCWRLSSGHAVPDTRGETVVTDDLELGAWKQAANCHIAVHPAPRGKEKKSSTRFVFLGGWRISRTYVHTLTAVTGSTRDCTLLICVVTGKRNSFVQFSTCFRAFRVSQYLHIERGGRGHFSYPFLRSASIIFFFLENNARAMPGYDWDIRIILCIMSSDGKLPSRESKEIWSLHCGKWHCLSLWGNWSTQWWTVCWKTETKN